MIYEAIENGLGREGNGYKRIVNLRHLAHIPARISLDYQRSPSHHRLESFEVGATNVRTMERAHQEHIRGRRLAELLRRCCGGDQQQVDALPPRYGFWYGLE